MGWILFTLVTFYCNVWNGVSASEGEYIIGCESDKPFYSLTFRCSQESNDWSIATAASNSEIRCTNEVVKTCDIRLIFFNNCKFVKFPTNILNSLEHVLFYNLAHHSLASFETLTNADLNDFTGSKGGNISLDIMYNNIKEINVNSLGSPIPKVKDLNLQGNNLEKLIADGFSGFSKLEVLDLQSNKINEIDSLAFQGLNKLTGLFLSYNKITRINQTVFDQLTNLNSLLLAFNGITEIQPSAFRNLKELLILDLSYNNIVEIKNETLLPLVNLMQLMLSKNKLKNINFIPKIERLGILSVDGNQLITEMPTPMNEFFPDLRVLKIGNNNFNCTYLESFLSKLSPSIQLLVDRSTEELTKIRGIECFNPGEFRTGESVTEKPESNSVSWIDSVKKFFGIN